MCSMHSGGKLLMVVFVILDVVAAALVGLIY